MPGSFGTELSTSPSARRHVFTPPVDEEGNTMGFLSASAGYLVNLLSHPTFHPTIDGLVVSEPPSPHARPPAHLISMCSDKRSLGHKPKRRHSTCTQTLILAWDWCTEASALGAQSQLPARTTMALLPSVVLALASARSVYGWGVLGHATVAYVAQNYLDSDVVTWAQGVLDDTSDSYFANIASWADDYRETTAGAWSAPFHFIDAQDNPPTTCDVDYTRDCTSAGCSVSAIANYTQRVADGRLSAANTAQALKFLVHFLGDITQPLHDEALDVGGNTITVTFDGYDDDNLHADWDTYMPEKLIGGDTLADASSWAATLIKEIDSGSYKSLAASWIADSDISDVVASASAWATDANAYVCSVVMPNGVAALQKGDLYPTYYNSVIPTIELQLAKGGYRLADWLNQVYAANIASRRRDASVVVRGAGSVEARELPEFELNERQFHTPKSSEMLAREAMGGSCGCSAARGLGKRGHEHAH
uniref:Nuclease PA3 n=1 Tax=Mycena chlorophos TaxID=658473 RepID=A0ABQ0M2B0_MYCCL|nr:nuclease PA3 [Mycena chlorophos]